MGRIVSIRSFLRKY